MKVCPRYPIGQDTRAIGSNPRGPAAAERSRDVYRPEPRSAAHGNRPIRDRHHPRADRRHGALPRRAHRVQRHWHRVGQRTLKGQFDVERHGGRTAGGSPASPSGCLSWPSFRSAPRGGGRGGLRVGSPAAPLRCHAGCEHQAVGWPSTRQRPGCGQGLTDSCGGQWVRMAYPCAMDGQDADLFWDARGSETACSRQDYTADSVAPSAK
jgi:hypothetical protein